MPNDDTIPEALDAHAVELKLTEVPNWDADMDISTLSRVFHYKNFTESMSFVNAVAALAEAQNHHPDILVSYNTVTLVLMTHSAGGVTEKDFLLASLIDKIAEAAEAHDGNDHFLAG